MSTIEDARVEMYLGGWIDVTSDVRVNPGISITRGRQNEGTTITTPGVCTFTLENGANASGGVGTYDPRWPLSPFYGVLGKGAPVRVGLRRAWDTFARTSGPDSWGTSDSGSPWSTGTNNTGAADWAVAGGTATQMCSATGMYIRSVLGGFSQRDVDVKVTFSLAVSDVAGGALEPANLVVRYTDANNYNMIRVSIDTSEVITLNYLSLVAGVETLLTTGGPNSAYNGTTATGLTLTAGQQYTVRVLVENSLTRAKIWATNTPEPFDWLWQVRTNDNYNAGSVGVRSGVASGNTNTPVTFTYDNFEVMAPRFHGEVSKLPQKQDQSGKNRWVEVEAADILRRLQTGATPLQSTLRRAIPALPDLVAYWPLEDGTNATQAAAGITGVQPLEVAGAVKFATDSSFEGSDKIAVPNNGTLHGTVPVHTVGYEMVRFLVHVPASGMSDGESLIMLATGGTFGLWKLVYYTAGGGSLALQWYAAGTGAFVAESAQVDFAMNDRPCMLSVELRQNGSGIDWSWVTVEPGATSGGAFSGSIAASTLGAITDVWVTQDANVQNCAFGHLHVQRVFHSLFDLGAPLNAWRGEFAANRSVRIANETGLAKLTTYRSPQAPVEAWTQMGAQGIKTIVDLWEDNAQTDLALIYQARGSAHLLHRTHPSMQAQKPRATIDVAAGQLGAPPVPLDDDQGLTNDVTAKRVGGSSYRVVLTSGRNSTASPAVGGIGVYATENTYNVGDDAYLSDIAGWKLALGTYDGPRYPLLTVLRHSPRVVADTALFAALLDVDQGDILMIENLPLGDDRAMVFGYKETLTPFTHVFVFNSGPGDPWNIALTDDADSRVDTDASTLTSSITDSATSISVTTAAGSARWIDSATYASEFPLDIVIGGEQMTVTAISGTASPQTFTVTRAVNGITKAHAAGESVHLADPVYIGAGIQR